LSRRDEIVYLRSLKAYLGLVLVLFFAAALSGFQAAARDPEFSSRWLGELEMLRWILNLDPLLIMLMIFLKNLIASTIAMLLGLGLGVIPTIVIISNGVLLGVVAESALEQHGAAFLLAGIVPHGIVELPIVLACAAIGLRLGHLLALALIGREVDLAGETKIALRFLLWWAAPLLLLAAAIETFITPIALSMVIA